MRGLWHAVTLRQGKVVDSPPQSGVIVVGDVTTQPTFQTERLTVLPAALVAALQPAFRTLDLARLAGVTDVPNEASRRMLVRAGFELLSECEGLRHRLRAYLLDRWRFTRGNAP